MVESTNGVAVQPEKQEPLALEKMERAREADMRKRGIVPQDMNPEPKEVVKAPAEPKAVEVIEEVKDRAAEPAKEVKEPVKAKKPFYKNKVEPKAEEKVEPQVKDTRYLTPEQEEEYNRKLAFLETDIDKQYEEYFANSPSRLSDADKYKIALERAGTSQKGIEEALLEFGDMSEAAQKMLVKDISRELKAEHDAKRPNYKTFNVDNTAKEAAAKKQEMFASSVNNYVNSLKEKTEHFGISINEKRLSKLNDAINNGFLSKDKDGNINPEEYSDMIYLWTNRDEIFDGLVQFGRANASDEIAAEQTASGGHTPKSAPVSQDVNFAQLSGRERFNRSIKPVLDKIK